MYTSGDDDIDFEQAINLTLSNLNLMIGVQKALSTK